MARPNNLREVGRQERLESALAYQMRFPVEARNTRKVAEYEASLKRLRANLPEFPETGNPLGANIGVPLAGGG